MKKFFLVCLASIGCALISCGGTADNACVKAAKESRDFKKDLADEKWDDAQFEISKISDRDLRLLQRTNSSDIRTAKYEQADFEYEEALLKCETSASAP